MSTWPANHVIRRGKHKMHTKLSSVGQACAWTLNSVPKLPSGVISYDIFCLYLTANTCNGTDCANSHRHEH